MTLKWTAALHPTGQMFTAWAGCVALLRVVREYDHRWTAGVTFAGSMTLYHLDGVSGVRYETREDAQRALVEALRRALGDAIAALG